MLVAMHLEDLLNELGHRVAGTATRVERAVELARTARIDLAILDINLSGATSFPVAAILRERNIRFLLRHGLRLRWTRITGRKSCCRSRSIRPT